AGRARVVAHPGVVAHLTRRAGATTTLRPMREGITTVYGWLALVWAGSVVCQAFFAGLGIFGASSFDTHKAFGNVLHALTALLLLLAIAGRRSGSDIGMV